MSKWQRQNDGNETWVKKLGNEQNFSVTKKNFLLGWSWSVTSKNIESDGKIEQCDRKLTDNCTHLARSVSMWSAQ